MIKLWLLSILTLTSCGKQPPETNTETIKHNTYLISGQSNSVRLLYSQTSYYNDPIGQTNISDLVPQNNPNIYGYGVGGTTIEWWLIDSNSAPLIEVIKQHCDTNPYFIWYQGEGDTDDKELNYRQNMTTFFNNFLKLCPKMQIVEISLALADSVKQRYPRAIDLIEVQKTLGYPYIDASNYELKDEAHLSQNGYKELFKEIQRRFPLGE